MTYLAKRMREPSSWAGMGSIITSLAMFAATKDPTHLGAAVAGLVAIAAPEGRP